MLPENLESFEQHVATHAELWYNFCRQAYEYADASDAEIASLQDRLTQATDQVTQLKASLEEQYQATQRMQGEQAFLEKELVKYQGKYEQALKNEIRAKDNESHALSLAAPTVTTPVSKPTGSPAEENPVLPNRTPVTPPPSTPSSSRLSERMPDPDKFKGERKDFLRFSTQFRAKMTVNQDRFPTAASRVAYLASRLEGPAYAQLLPHLHADSAPGLTDYIEGLQVLDHAFGDPNRVNNARKELLSLRQANQEFGTFFATFHRLALEAKMHQDSLPTILEAAVSQELHSQLVYAINVPRDDYHELAKFLQNMENNRRYYQDIGRAGLSSRFLPSHRLPSNARTTTTYVTKNVRASPPSVSPMSVEPMDLDNIKGKKMTPAIRTYCDKKRLCYYCKGPGHISQNCPSRPSASRLHETVPETPLDEGASQRGGVALSENGESQ
jgi:hypothetical protein